jgi:hypothetical protein
MDWKGVPVPNRVTLKAFYSAAIDGEVAALNNKTAATNETTALRINITHPSLVLIRKQGYRYFVLLIHKFDIYNLSWRGQIPL